MNSLPVLFNRNGEVGWVGRLIGIDYPSGDVRITLGEGLMSHQHAPEIQPDGSILVGENRLAQRGPHRHDRRVRALGD
ncbi:MAG: hypothetical protein ACYS0E_15660 [Planctomycetota bacterium]|jgi:hypothetical protein